MIPPKPTIPPEQKGFAPAWMAWSISERRWIRDELSFEALWKFERMVKIVASHREFLRSAKGYCEWPWISTLFPTHAVGGEPIVEALLRACQELIGIAVRRILDGRASLVGTPA